MIHHATTKRAESNGVVLSEINDENGTRFRAHWAEQNQVVVGASGTKAADVLDDMLALKTAIREWPALSCSFGDDGVWEVELAPAAVGIASAARLQDALDEALEYCQENEVDPAELPEGQEEEAEPVVVVHSRYRQEYAARGNSNHCGDWLAEILDGKFQVLTEGDGPTKGRFDHLAFAAMLEENGVDMSGKWASLPHSGQNGWIGRYRMNGRQKLEQRVAEAGVLLLFGHTYTVPEEALEKLWERHPDAATTFEEAKVSAEKEAVKAKIEARRPRQGV